MAFQIVLQNVCRMNIQNPCPNDLQMYVRWPLRNYCPNALQNARQTSFKIVAWMTINMQAKWPPKLPPESHSMSPYLQNCCPVTFRRMSNGLQNCCPNYLHNLYVKWPSNLMPKWPSICESNGLQNCSPNTLQNVCQMAFKSIAQRTFKIHIK